MRYTITKKLCLHVRVSSQEQLVENKKFLISCLLNWMFSLLRFCIVLFNI